MSVRIMDQLSPTTISRSRYDCPRHGVALVLEVITLSPLGHALSGIRTVEFYRCPILGERGQPDIGQDGRCNFMKPNTWQRKPYAPRTR